MASARTNLRNAIKTALTTIIAGNNSGNGYTYVNTIRDININDRPRSVENMREFPSINLEWGEEIAANADVGRALQTGGNRQLLHNSFDIMFDCFLKAEDQSLAQDDMLADIQALFGNNYSITDTAFNVVYRSSIPFGMAVNNGPNCGITIICRVWYRIYSSNPDTLG